MRGLLSRELRLTKTQAPHFERLLLNGGLSVGINFVKASQWTVSNSIIVGAQNAIIVANGNNGDSGDSTIYGNMLQSNSVAIVWNSSRGLRIENNKILGVGQTAGISISLTNGVSTSDIFVVGNSIEGLATTGIGVNLQRAGTSGGLNHVMISNNELGGGQHPRQQLPAGQRLNGVWIYRQQH